MQRGGFVRKQKCPKCGGNMFLDMDSFGWYEQCLQCGFSSHLGQLVELKDKDGNKYYAEPEKVEVAPK
jgi:hypothetical protein